LCSARAALVTALPRKLLPRLESARDAGSPPDPPPGEEGEGEEDDGGEAGAAGEEDGALRAREEAEEAEEAAPLKRECRLFAVEFAFEMELCRRKGRD